MGEGSVALSHLNIVFAVGDYKIVAGDSAGVLTAFNMFQQLWRMRLSDVTDMLHTPGSKLVRNDGSLC
jgi:hypothetical protein